MDRFPNPEEMLKKVAQKGRKMVGTIDPHLKEDDNYWVYKEGRDSNLFIKDKNGNDYKGFCWPGN